MLRVTLWEVRIAEDVVQSSLSKSVETSRVDAVLELEAPPPRPPNAYAAQFGEKLRRREGRERHEGREGKAKRKEKRCMRERRSA